MVKTRNLPDDPGEGRTITGAEGEATAQPSVQATGPEEGSQARPDPEPPVPETATETGRERAKLVFASFLMLFVELALIRWVTANNVFVTKATNFVLLASFLGIGIGFLNAKTNRDYLRWTPVALLALVSFVLAFPVILQTLNGPDPFQGLRGTPALPQPVSLGIVFVLVVGLMAGLGQGTARLLVGFRPLRASRFATLA